MSVLSTNIRKFFDHHISLVQEDSSVFWKVTSVLIQRFIHGTVILEIIHTPFLTCSFTLPPSSSAHFMSISTGNFQNYLTAIRNISIGKAFFGDMRPFTITPSSALILMKFRMIQYIIRFSLEWRPGIIHMLLKWIFVELFHLSSVTIVVTV